MMETAMTVSFLFQCCCPPSVEGTASGFVPLTDVRLKLGGLPGDMTRASRRNARELVLWCFERTDARLLIPCRGIGPAQLCGEGQRRQGNQGQSNGVQGYGR